MIILNSLGYFNSGRVQQPDNTGETLTFIRYPLVVNDQVVGDDQLVLRISPKQGTVQFLLRHAALLLTSISMGIIG